MKKLVLYNHGKDSTPWSEKTLAFAEIAKKHGYQIQSPESPDYRNQQDPDERVKQLLSMDLTGYDEVVLIGFSMGAYVATVAAETIKPNGLFLLAPAFYLPDYKQTKFSPPADCTKVYHGWRDDIVAPENSWKFCQKYYIHLQILDSDHRLINKLTYLQQEFDRFLCNLSQLP